METFKLALLLGATLWLMDLYHARKFGFFYPKLRADLLPQGAANWKRFWVYRNQTLKRVAIFTMWAGATLGAHFWGIGERGESRVSYAVGFLGGVFYVASQLWPIIVKKPRLRGSSNVR